MDSTIKYRATISVIVRNPDGTIKKDYGVVCDSAQVKQINEASPPTTNEATPPRDK